MPTSHYIIILDNGESYEDHEETPIAATHDRDAAHSFSHSWSEWSRRLRARLRDIAANYGSKTEVKSEEVFIEHLDLMPGKEVIKKRFSRSDIFNYSLDIVEVPTLPTGKPNKAET